MKIAAFDDLYPMQLSTGGTLLIVSDGSNSGSSGGDIVGEAGDLSVVRLGSTVSLSSNLTGSVGDVLTLIATSPLTAQFATSSNSGASAGSNSTRVSEVSSAGASTTLFSPFDHLHDGIGTITASSSNTMQRGTFNLRAGTNVSFGLTDSDSDGELDTLTLHAPLMGSGVVSLSFAGSTTNEGNDSGRNTAGSYNALKGYVTVYTPMLLDKVLWDIRNAGDYTLTIAAYVGTTLATVGPVTVSGLTADKEFDLSPDLTLQPGNYSFTLTKSSSAVTWTDYDPTGTPDIYFDSFTIRNGIHYDTSYFDYQPPFRLVYYKGTWLVS